VEVPPPDLSSFHALIRACGHSGDGTRALAIYSALCDASDDHVRTALVCLCAGVRVRVYVCAYVVGVYACVRVCCGCCAGCARVRVPVM
jgi:hypothetical protein